MSNLEVITRLKTVLTKKLLFSGDILFTDFHPFLADGDFNGWSTTLDSLLAIM